MQQMPPRDREYGHTAEKVGHHDERFQQQGYRPHTEHPLCNDEREQDESKSAMRGVRSCTRECGKHEDDEAETGSEIAMNPSAIG